MATRIVGGGRRVSAARAGSIAVTGVLAAVLVHGSAASRAAERRGFEAGRSFDQGRPARVSAGTGTLYIGGWPNRIMILDEALEKVVAEIPLQTGAPRGMDVSRDRTRIYTLTTTLEDIEVVDVAARKVIDRFRLSSGSTRVRIRGMTADPLHRFLVLVTKSATKQMDRFEIGPPELQVFDLKARKVTRTIPWPRGEEREFANLMLAPDGKYLYFFSDDVLVYETSEFKEVDRWELSRPLEEGLGRFDFGPRDVTNEEPGFYTGLFFVRDPVQNREMMGIARVNLSQKSVEFYTLGPSRRVSFALAPDRKRAHGLLQEIGRYEFWTFDLEARRLASQVPFNGRPRMSLRPSSNGKVLYIYGAGNTIDLYDASTHQYLRTITLDADTTTELFVVPPK